jgi:hypothetical protein
MADSISKLKIPEDNNNKFLALSVMSNSKIMSSAEDVNRFIGFFENNNLKKKVSQVKKCYSAS